MHQACVAFWKYASEQFSPYFTEDILEFGSYDINGTIRDHFKNHKRYIGIDWRPGPCVDIVGLAHEVRFNFKARAILSASMLEHDPYWEKSLENMINHLTPNGILVLSWGSAKNLPHCLLEAPDGEFHCLQVEKVTRFLENNGLFIHTSIYDQHLKDLVKDYDLRKTNGEFGYVNNPNINGMGEHNLIAINKGFISPLDMKDRI